MKFLPLPPAPTRHFCFCGIVSQPAAMPLHAAPVRRPRCWGGCCDCCEGLQGVQNFFFLSPQTQWFTITQQALGKTPPHTKKNTNTHTPTGSREGLLRLAKQVKNRSELKQITFVREDLARCAASHWSFSLRGGKLKAL